MHYTGFLCSLSDFKTSESTRRNSCLEVSGWESFRLGLVTTITVHSNWNIYFLREIKYKKVLAVYRSMVIKSMNLVINLFSFFFPATSVN